MEHDHHRTVKRRLLDNLHPSSAFIAAEHRLPNGKIADIIQVDRDQSVYIYEIKTQITKDYTATVYDKYHQFADYLFLVYTRSPHSSINKLNKYHLAKGERHNTVGLAYWDGHELNITRDARLQHPPWEHAPSPITPNRR